MITRKGRISDALPLEAARPASGFFYHRAPPTKFQHSLAIHGWVIDDQHIFLTSFQGTPMSFLVSDLVDRTVPSLGEFWRVIRLSATILDFWYDVLFSNEGDSKTTKVENLGQVLHLWNPVKFRGWVGKKSESILLLTIEYNFWYAFDWAPFSWLGNWSLDVKKFNSKTAKQNVFDKVWRPNNSTTAAVVNI